MMDGRRWLRVTNDLLVVSGELTQSTVASFENELSRLPDLPPELVVDLSNFEIDDGVAAVAAVNAMRLLARGRHVILREAPQLLAHNLYRVAALEDGHITLQSMREDEPYG